MLFVGLLLTVIVYLFFPIIYISTNDKLPEPIAKKYALINAIVCAGIFIIIRAISGLDALAAGGFAPAVLYYFIAKAILTDKNVKTPTDSKQNETNADTQTQDANKDQDDNK